MNSYRWEDLKVGMSASFDVRVRSSDMERFLEISGDSNPLHLDESYAKGCGFGSRVVYGLILASYYSRLVGMYLPGQFCLLHGIDVDFVAPVYPEERLNISGRVTHLSEAYRQITVAAAITNQEGAKVSRAKIKVGLHGT